MDSRGRPRRCKSRQTDTAAQRRLSTCKARGAYVRLVPHIWRVTDDGIESTLAGHSEEVVNLDPRLVSGLRDHTYRMLSARRMYLDPLELLS
ncbi:hypothetical protein NJB1604_06150 [Mycobacterium marinum]|nr:hypothetical protein NJB1604_06150 [Mycobacterium marinum]